MDSKVMFDLISKHLEHHYCLSYNSLYVYLHNNNSPHAQWIFFNDIHFSSY